MSETETGDPCVHRRRHAAGEDPKKRDQILEGAWHVFQEQGFDAATMNSICKRAGVSKGTIYVYFQNKEDLFVALVERKRQAFFEGFGARLNAANPEVGLYNYALGLAEMMCAEEVIRAQRIVIGVVERMPELGMRFFEAGARHVHGALEEWIARETAAGRLVAPDPSIAAQQFVELASAGIWRRRLFGRETRDPAPEELELVAHAAVRMFMASYGPKG